MQRPQSLEFQSVNKGKTSCVMPAMISYELKSSDTPTQRVWPIPVWSPGTQGQNATKPVPSIPLEFKRFENRNGGRIRNLDQQISKLNRMSSHCQTGISTRPYPCVPQSQSFCQNVYKSSTCTNMCHGSIGDTNHTSRLIASTYMSPPPTDWITVGNIVPVKRSTSMPGYRAVNSNLINTPNQCANATPITAKKRSGPFHCLKHSMKKSGVKTDQTPCSTKESVDLKPVQSVLTPSKTTRITSMMSLSSQSSKQNSDKIKVNRILKGKQMN